MMLRWRPFRLRSGPTAVREVHYAMGTLLDVTLYHAEPGLGLAILREACQEARRLESLLSRHLPGSELSRLNGRAGVGPMAVSRDLARLLTMARHWARRTRGAFDPTIGGVLELWREAARLHQKPPEEDQLQAALQGRGWWKLRLIPPRWVELAAAGMALDLGGIGKGYAADRMAGLLRRRGVRHALINFGESSLVAIGPRPDGQPWPIRVRTRDGAWGTQRLELRDLAMGTSASWGQRLMLAGKPLSHIVDPRDGLPLEGSCAVTVVAPTATAAEALSTALLVRTAAGEAVGTLPFRVAAFRVEPAGELIPLGRTAGDARVRQLRL